VHKRLEVKGYLVEAKHRPPPSPPPSTPPSSPLSAPSLIEVRRVLGLPRLEDTFDTEMNNSESVSTSERQEEEQMPRQTGT